MKRFARIALGVVAFVGLATIAALAPAEDSPTLGDKVVEFCKANLGQKVGNGQCGTLAAKALKAAGARQALDFEATHKPLVCPICGTTHKGGLAEFVFGKLVYRREAAVEGAKEVGKLSDVRPGDIVQFRHAKFAKQGFGHHTAIVAERIEESLKLYHQNVTPDQVVVKGSILPSTLSEGWICVYRPLPKSPDAK